jgi:hypothetical protein
METSMTIVLRSSAVLALAMVAASPVNAADGKWQWYGAPYLWMTSVKTDLKGGSGGGADFPDIVDKIDWAFQGHVEGQGDRLGVFGDVIYLSLSDDGVRTAYDTNASLDTTVVELAGVWNVSPGRFEGLDLFAGVRHIVANATVEFHSNSPPLPDFTAGVDQSFTDVMLGGRYTATVSDKWKVSTRLDGAWGDTDGTINASVMASRRMGNGSWVFSYRYMKVRLNENGDDVDLTLHGPAVAYAFGLR